jgi:hypothetical protein
MIDELLNQAVARTDSVAYIVLSAGGFISEDLAPEEAFVKLQNLKWVAPSAKGEEPLAADTLAFLTMKALGLGGGVFYTIFPSPRYAHRELVYRDILPSSVTPGRIVSGEEVLRVLRLALDLKGGKK